MNAGLTVGFIGAGTLGRSLALGLADAGYRVASVNSRSQTSADALAGEIPGCVATPHPQEVADRCDLVFVTTTDDAIGRVAASLGWSPGRGVAHCSGAGSLDLLRPAAGMGASCGSLHPFQTFAGVTGRRDAVERFQGVTFAVEGEGWMLETLEAMAAALGGRAIRVAPADRPLYHASAVMSCGSLVALLKAAAGLWPSLGFTEEEGLRAMLPMAGATLRNAAALGPQAALTGPIARGDVATLRGHLEAFKARQPDILPLYLALSEASVPLAAPALGDREVKALQDLISHYSGASIEGRGQTLCGE